MTAPRVTTTPMAYDVVRDAQTLQRALSPLMEAAVLGIDTETTGLDPFRDQLCLVQIAAPGHVPVIIDRRAIPAEALGLLRAVLAGPAIKVFQNAKFDLKFLRQAEVPVQGPYFDRMLAAQLLNAGLQSKGFGLADLTQKYLRETLAKTEQISDWSGELTPAQLNYAVRDATTVLRLREVLIPLLKAAKLVAAARLEFDGLPAVVDMEMNGIRLDAQRCHVVIEELTRAREQATARLRQRLQLMGSLQHAGRVVDALMLNLDAPQQLLSALRALGIPVTNTAESTLAQYLEAHPIVPALLAYRKAAKAVQMVERLPSHIHPVTGRIHPEYLQLGTTTGRFACRQPNLQQTPRGGGVRGCFIADPGCRIVRADLSQIELRIAAELAQEPRMIEAFCRGDDLHRLTAALLLGKAVGDVTPEERQVAKAVNFGLIYGMRAAGLRAHARDNYGVELDDPAQYIERFFAGYSVLARQHRRLDQSRPSETRTRSGRRRRWPATPELTELLNTPVQGTGADMLKMAMAPLPAALTGTNARLVGTVHDEIILEAPEEEAPVVGAILKHTMEEAGRCYLTQVPVVAEVTIADSWAKA
jgi:DNA polymerase-1